MNKGTPKDNTKKISQFPSNRYYEYQALLPSPISPKRLKNLRQIRYIDL